MIRTLALLLLLTGCAKAPAPPDPSAEQAQASACRAMTFEDSGFTICPADGATLQLAITNRAGRPLRTFAALQGELGARGGEVAFAMNAGMFDEEGMPIGLAIVEGKPLHALNTRRGGGNFHLQPNGVFLVRRDGTAAVVTTERFRPSPAIRLATQSGPMLVIDGALNPLFDPDGRSRYVRNGVGVGADGKVWFAISDSPVSFGKFARLFRDGLKSRNALYFDGSVSSLWDPANGRMDSFVPLGPMVVAFRG